MARRILLRFCRVLVGVSLLLGVPASVGGQISEREFREASRKLSDAVRSRDVGVFLEALKNVVGRDDGKAVRAAVGAYSSLAEVLEKGDSRAEFYRLHSRTASSFAVVSKKGALRELHRLRRKGRDWRGRLLLLDAASFNERLDLEECSIQALGDESPVVVRRALTYLERDRKVPVVEIIVERFLAFERDGPGEDASQWSRTILAFRATLKRLLYVDLPQAVDWKNYVVAHRHSEDLFKPPEERKGRGRTALTLFGAEVTGKNIVFVLDVSGSMTTTDPLPPEERGRSRSRGKTVVGEVAQRRERQRSLESRRRITRAKKELERVVGSLTEDVRFNLIAYSSEVRPWREWMVRASPAQKEAASKFVRGLEAKGVTVTDLALEEAFSDLEIDTVYLITDGAPTHVGSTTPGLPEDAEELMSRIHTRIRELNFLRDVRVFCLGFRGAEVDFLKKLARDNGGRFVEIR